MKPTIICLTPVRNEAWVLDRFLKAVSLWADHIIIADQMSTDGSREIAKKYQKVILIDNANPNFNEIERKRLLVCEARKIKGPRLLIALDADEMFSPEIFGSGEWDKILQLHPGTAIHFQWANFAPDLKTMWNGYFFPWGYMDDDFEDYDKGISESAIHCARVPISENTPTYKVESFKVIHFQYTDWERMKHKHYYYQCLEIVNNPEKSAIDIYRQYHHMDAISRNCLISIPQEWVETYNIHEINILNVIREKRYWYDSEILRLLKKFGTQRFRKVDIWGADWEVIANVWGTEINPKPSAFRYRLLFLWLRYTQKYNHYIIRRLDNQLKKFI